LKQSIWSGTTSLPAFEPLRGDLSTDVLIIGGGMAGLLCAYLLRQAGIDCVLAEASRICSGTTKNTTAERIIPPDGHGFMKNLFVCYFCSSVRLPLQLLQDVQFLQSQPQEVLPFFLFITERIITPTTITTARTITIISIII